MTRRLLYLLALLFLTAPCFGAEFLVMARDTPSGIKKGDIITIKTDGWSWGRLECLPDFIVVKVPGMALEAKYEQPIKVSETLTTERQYAVLATYIDGIVATGQSVVTITKTKLVQRLLDKALQ